MDIRKVKKLIELLEESGLAELEITEGEESVRISRQMTSPPQPYYAQPPMAASLTPGVPPSAPLLPLPETDRTPTAGQPVLSPMVGTYYETAAPGASNFVKIGDRIEVGATLCIIEAMKMMNQIESEFAGTLVATLVKNGDPVEFGQTLFIIQP